jgi:membrane protein implicated in regulation of membrane protease activity
MFINNSSNRIKSPYSGDAVIDRVVRKDELCRVKLDGVYWSAITVSPFALNSGDYVRVIGRQNCKLLIQEFQ